MLAERPEDQENRHQQGLLRSIDVVIELLALAEDVVKRGRETPARKDIDRGKAALTELFEDPEGERYWPRRDKWRGARDKNGNRYLIEIKWDFEAQKQERLRAARSAPRQVDKSKLSVVRRMADDLVLSHRSDESGQTPPMTFSQMNRTIREALGVSQATASSATRSSVRKHDPTSWQLRFTRRRR